MNEARSPTPGGPAPTLRPEHGPQSGDSPASTRLGSEPGPGIDCAWRLRLAHALQTTLDPERALDLFARHSARVVFHDGVAFAEPRAAARPREGTRDARRHCVRLTLDGRLLGTLAFARRHPFDPGERRALDAMSADLARPLDNARRHREAQEAATRDPLTGAANRTLLDSALEREASLLRRHGGSLALLMIDVDRFKQINDHFGHPAGDRCLASIAGCISHRIRRSDLLFRYGGEEFCVLLPRTGERGARRLAERVRAAVDALRIPAGTGSIRATVSLGVASSAPGDDAAELIAKADAALYRAKRSGRNRVSAPSAEYIPPPPSR